MKSNILKIVCILVCTLNISLTVHASTFSINYYEWDGNASDGRNIFEDYRIAGVGTFAVADSAISPNSLVMFSDPAFLSFEVTLNTLVGSGTFTLGADDFPDGAGPNAGVQPQGILFDNFAVPLRFETPNFSVSNNSPICDPDCSASAIASGIDRLVLLDNGSFDQAYLTDGTIKSNTALTIPPGTPHTRIGGNWTFRDDVVGIGISNNLYVVSPAVVPIPAAVWLFGSSLLGLIGVARRKKAA